jgi:hypothetical protein
MITRILKQSDIQRCPHFILLASHYRSDGTCRCNEMKCEYTSCKREKWGGEIYCEIHLENFGYWEEPEEEEAAN